ncbi:MAG: ABC transporter permease, partial [Gammaproteobacteria bacterium]
MLAVLLLVSVFALPLLLKDDGTARGFIQIMLAYTLTVITALLGFSTLWLACGTLARDIEDCSMQMVAVKPIARWQIWLGKFIGIMLLNATLLAASGALVFGLLHWRTSQMEQAAARARQAGDKNLADYIESQVNILSNEIFVARAALKEPVPDIEAAVDRALAQVIREKNLSPEQQEETRKLLREEIRSRHQVVPPNHLRRWTIDLGLRRHLLRDQPLFMRVKFHVAMTNETGSYLGLWTVGPPDGTRAPSLPQSLAADTFHEIQIPPNLFDESGKLTIDFENRNNTALIFPLEDGLEVLYREGGFALNFARGLA